MSTAKITVAVIAGVCAASAAGAQDGTETILNRTPANAQKFIAVTPPTAFWLKGEHYLLNGDVTSVDACTTLMTGKRADRANNTWSLAPATIKIRKGALGVIYRQVWLPGSQIVNFEENSVAERTGLRRGDIVLKFNGVEASGIAYQRALAESVRTQTPVQVEYSRKGVTATIAIVAMPDPANEQIDVPGPDAPPTPLKIEWSKVQQVKSADGNGLTAVSISLPGATGLETIELYYVIPEVRDRVLSAAQYLKTACDRSKELGF